MNSREEPSIILKVFEGEDQDLDFFRDSFSYQVSIGTHSVIRYQLELIQLLGIHWNSFSY